MFGAWLCAAEVLLLTEAPVHLHFTLSFMIISSKIQPQHARPSHLIHFTCLIICKWSTANNQNSDGNLRTERSISLLAWHRYGQCNRINTNALLNVDWQIPLYVSWFTDNRHSLLQGNSIHQVTQVHKRSGDNKNDVKGLRKGSFKFNIVKPKPK